MTHCDGDTTGNSTLLAHLNIELADFILDVIDDGDGDGDGRARSIPGPRSQVVDAH